MNLLVITQKINKDDDHFVFFLDWIRELNVLYDNVTVVTLWRDEHDLPDDIKVISLGKEGLMGDSHRSNHLHRLFYGPRLLWYAWRQRKGYDHVFVHMNPEYMLAAPLWRILGKKVGLWYVHRHADVRTRIALFFSHVVFTVSEKSFSLKSSKVRYMGHGVNSGMYKCDVLKDKVADPVILLSVSRISPIKNLDTLIRATKLIGATLGRPVCTKIVSWLPERPGDQHYELYQDLQKLVKEEGLEDSVVFTGALPAHEVVKLYCKADLTVNPLPDGGLDKVIVESIFSRVPVLSSNNEARETFGKYADLLTFKLADHEDLADKAVHLLRNEPSDLRDYLWVQADKLHNTKSLVSRMVGLLSTVDNGIDLKLAKIVRYVISGGTAAVVNLGLLYALTEFLNLWYMFSAVTSFIFSLAVSFSMQKFWTFRDHNRDGIHSQAAMYVIVSLVNLAVNSILIYAFTELAGIWYIFSALIAGAIVALVSFFVYKFIIFKRVLGKH